MSARKAPHEKNLFQGQIDRLVYDLYGLTEEEIWIVEGGTTT